MLHIVAFLAIGIVVGYFVSPSSIGSALAVRIVASLVASFVGGEAMLLIFGTTSVLGKYGSILVALVLAAIVSFLLPKKSAGSAPQTASPQRSASPASSSQPASAPPAAAPPSSTPPAAPPAGPPPAQPPSPSA